MKHRMTLIIMAAAVFVFAASVGGSIPYFLLYFYGLSLLIPLVHSLLGRKWLTGQLQLPEEEIIAGQEIKLKYAIINPLPIAFSWLELQNEIGYRLTGIREENIVFPLEAKGVMRGETTIVCRRRGLYETGEILLKIKDVMNIYTFKKRIKEPMLLKVYPQITTLTNFRIRASQQMGDLLVKDPLLQDISEVSDLRQYNTGDSVKRIHWRLSAKRDELLVKNYEQKGDTQILLLLDSFVGSYREDAEGRIEDKLVETAASIIEYCLKRNVQLSLCSMSEGKSRLVKGDNPQYIKAFMDELVLFHPTGELQLEMQVERAMNEAQQGLSLLLLTPQLNKSTGAQGIHLKRKNLNPIFIVVGDKSGEGEWAEGKAVGKKLVLEGIPVYFIDLKQDIRSALEGRYEKGA